MQETRTRDLEVTDESGNVFQFPIVTEKGRPSIETITRPWQEGDPLEPWRHKLDFSKGLGGLDSGRGHYTKGPIDLIGNIMVPGPYSRKMDGSIIRYLGEENTSGTDTSIIVDVPAGVVENDYLLAMVQLTSVQEDVTSTGWTVLKRYDGASGSFHILRRLAPSSVPSDYTFSWTSSAAAVATIIAWDGVHTSSLEADTDFTVEDTIASSAYSLTGPSYTGSAGGKVLYVFMEADNLRVPEITGDNLWEFANREPLAFYVLETNLDESGNARNLTPTFNAEASGNGEQIMLGVISLTPTSSVSLSLTGGAGTVYFDNKLFFNAVGDDIWYIDEYGILTYDGDLSDDHSLSNTQDISFTVFENELIGWNDNAAGKIVKRTAGYRGTWSQPTDNVQGYAGVVVGDKLWRVEDQNKVTNCLTGAFTLANWVPSSGNEYTAGDTEYYPVDAIEYDGSLWVSKHDGLYAPNNQYEFINQTPQLKRSPHHLNGSNIFNAKGYLWVPYAQGILRVTIGEAIDVGPSLSGKPGYPWFTHGGAEIDGRIYLWNSKLDWYDFDEPDVIVKLVEDGDGGYNYYEIGEPYDSTHNVGGMSPVLGADTIGYFTPNFLFSKYHRVSTMHNVIIGGPIQKTFGPQRLTPVFVTAPYSTTDGDINWTVVTEDNGFKDNRYYPYSGYWAFETPYISPIDDKNTEIALQGLEVTCKLGSDQTLDFTYGLDGADIDQSFYADGEATTSGQLTNTTNIETKRLFVDLSTSGIQCQMFRLGMVGANTNIVAGTNRPEIHDVVAFGYTQPDSTDVKRIQLFADAETRSQLGVGNGLGVSDISNKWRTWKNDGKVRLMKLPDYEESNNTYFKVGNVTEQVIDIAEDRKVDIITVDLVRVNYKDDYAS